MNRKERRAQKVERKRAQVKARRSERNPSPAYVALVKRLAQLTVQWCRAQFPPPELRFHDRGDILYCGSLGDPHAVKYLANSPDAFRLCAWLDEQTGREATLFQMDCALRVMGAFNKPEAKYTSRAMEMLTTFAEGSGTDSPVPPSPCGHCGVLLEMACGKKGEVPEEGMFSVCVKCGGLNEFGPGLALVAFPDERLEELPAEGRAHLEEARDLMRMARLGYKQPRKATVFS